MAQTAVSLERGLPSSPDAERSILGAIMLENKAYGEAASVLTAEDFSLDSHRRIYRAMTKLIADAGSFDLITLAEEMTRKREVESVGGVAYIASLTDGVPRRPNIEHYVTIVRDKAVLRELITTSQRAMADAIAQERPATEILEDVQQSVLDIINHGQQGRLISVEQAAQETFACLEKIRTMKGQVIGVPTGIEDLDLMTTGFRGKEFYVIGARPGMGKTAWMCQSIAAAVSTGHRPGVFSIEVDRMQIMTRLACQVKNMSVFQARDPRDMNDSEFLRLAEGIGEVSGWPFFLEDSPRMDAKQLCSIARLWASRGCDVIYVDHLQKLRAEGRDDFQRVSNATRALWELARSLGIPVVALSQLRRREGNPAPELEDFRSSGDIEQDAHAAFGIWRPTESDGESNTFTERDQFIILKQRSGPSMRYVKVRFDAVVGLFRSGWNN